MECTMVQAGKGARGGPHTYLDDLRQDLVSTVAVGAFAVAHLWLCWMLYMLRVAPPYDGTPLGLAWLGGAVLWAGAIASYSLRHTRPLLAVRVLVGAVMCAIACCTFGFGPPGLVYLCVIPFVLAGAALDGKAFLSCFVLALLALLQSSRMGTPTASAETFRLGLTIGAVALVTWASSRALDTALTWVWDAYQRARKNEALARERQGQLSQTLKALDEAQYRLERNNYLLALARDEAEEARQAKQQFIQTISHELRTPLNLIIGFSEIMANDPETYGDMAWPANLRSDVEQIYRSSRHLASLIDDVLDLSAVEARRMRLSLQQTDIRQVIEEAVSVVRGLFERKGLYLKIDVAHDVPELLVDPLRIRQVLLNLLSNASRHTDAGGVSIAVKRTGDSVQVSVADTGSGIAPEERHKVFEEFGRPDGPGRRSEGTGLGLALSKRFVELHGGTMDFESTPGKGTRFYFSLPVPSKEARARQPRLLRTPGRAGPPRTPGLPLLLVAGVDSLQRAALRRLEGFAVMEVSRPQDLPRLAEQYRPAGLVINSGDGDASALLQTWSSHAPSDIPIIALALHDSFTRPQPLHVHEFLLKPVTRERLLEAIGRLRAPVETVLIVDDDLQVAELLSRMLESAGRGWRTVKCFGGQEALNRMFREPPDLVLLDLVLADVDGQTVLQTMRKSQLLARTPVIVVTGRDHLDMIEGGRMLTLWRGKAYSCSELLACLRVLLSAHPPGHGVPTPAPALSAAPVAGQVS